MNDGSHGGLQRDSATRAEQIPFGGAPKLITYPLAANSCPTS